MEIQHFCHDQHPLVFNEDERVGYLCNGGGEANMTEAAAPQISLSISFKCFVSLKSFIVKQ